MTADLVETRSAPPESPTFQLSSRPDWGDGRARTAMEPLITGLRECVLAVSKEGTCSRMRQSQKGH